MEQKLNMTEERKVVTLAVISFGAGILGNLVAHNLRTGNKYTAILLATGGILATYFVLKYDR
ncbi:MAG: hypothetical protein WCT77_00260 [Bacteroidota bacterium]|jgi:hypothetical protein